jgi:putative resolvase
VEKFIGIREAAETLGVAPKTLRKWESQGKITSFRTIGGHRRYDLDALRKMIEEARK